MKTFIASLLLTTCLASQRPGITLQQFKSVKDGMTRHQADSVMCLKGTVKWKHADTSVIVWPCANGLGNAEIMFYKNRVLPDVPGS